MPLAVPGMPEKGRPLGGAGLALLTAAAGWDTGSARALPPDSAGHCMLARSLLPDLHRLSPELVLWGVCI